MSTCSQKRSPQSTFPPASKLVEPYLGPDSIADPMFRKGKDNNLLWTYHDTKSPAQRIRQPPGPREREANFCRVQEKHQLRQARTHILRVAIIKVGVDVSKEFFVCSLCFRRCRRRRRRDSRRYLDDTGPFVRIVDLESVSSACWNSNRLRVCS